ncbi:hypothetical protein [Desulfopila inferna]|uniref:hypothetical protein n=1 Tax=Desulfopila inferna TaxID=468528 RepID=UPI001963280F|nr:hypothetical protein [Desulfopila inferna]MBM9606029.1 hypothetical protein [Desulfopila inferna]
MIEDKNGAVSCSLGIVLFMVGMVSPGVAVAITHEEILKKQEIIPSLTGAYDHFGTSIAVSGDILAVGMPNYDSFWEDSGTVYLYEKINNHWKEKKRLLARTQQQQGLFGYSVAIEGPYLVVGEPGTLNRQNGYAHVFHRDKGGPNNWGWVRTLSKPDDCYLRVSDRFGESVSISDGKVLIGAPKACKNRQSWMETTGAAYLYTNYGANLIKKLIAHNGEDYDYFGASVSVCDSFAFVGAPDADSGVLRSNSGAAYLFNAENSWGLHSYLRPHDTQEGDRFGQSLSCHAGAAVIGAPASSKAYGSDLRKGSIYFYHNNDDGGDAWLFKAKLHEESYFNEDPDRNNLFGQTVSIRDNYLMVGYGESEKSEADLEPVAQIFKLKNGEWKLLKGMVLKKEPSCQTSSIDKGISVATDGATFVTGDMENESTSEKCAIGVGSAAIFERSFREIINMSPVLLLLKKK